MAQRRPLQWRLNIATFFSIISQLPFSFVQWTENVKRIYSIVASMDIRLPGSIYGPHFSAQFALDLSDNESSTIAMIAKISRCTRYIAFSLPLLQACESEIDCELSETKVPFSLVEMKETIGIAPRERDGRKKERANCKRARFAKTIATSSLRHRCCISNVNVALIHFNSRCVSDCSR